MQHSTIKIETFVNEVGKHGWRVVHQAMGTIAVNGQFYDHRADMLQHIGLLKKEFPNAMVLQTGSNS